MVQLPKYYESACRDALAHFRSRRRCSGGDGDDEYVEQLQQVDKAAYT